MYRSKLFLAIIAISYLGASNFAHGGENAVQDHAKLKFSRIGAEATAAGWEAYETGNETAIEKLVTKIRILACERDNDKTACEALSGFENGTAPAFPEGQTALAGSLVLGTLVRGDRYSLCLFKSEQGSVHASCFLIEPPKGMEKIEPGRSISGALAEHATNPLSPLHSYITDGFENHNFFPLEFSFRQARYHWLGGYKLNRKIPAILRWHNGRLYAATIMFVNPRGSFDSYPTLSLYVMRMVRVNQ
jgi:hypothetical protein